MAVARFVAQRPERTSLVNLVKVFLLMMLLGGVGGALGSMLGNALGRGGVIGAGIMGGALLVVAGGFLATRWRWVRPEQRLWCILGGVAGFALAALVTLSTLSSPTGPILSTLLIGTGAVLGALVGSSAHEQS